MLKTLNSDFLDREDTLRPVLFVVQVMSDISKQEAPRSIMGRRAKWGKSFPDAITLLHRPFC